MSARKGLAYDMTALLAMPELSGVFTLSTITEGAYDPVADSFGAPSSSGYTANGALINYSMLDRQNAAILERDKRLVLDASTLAVEPLPGMIVIAGASGGNYSIVQVREFAPDGTVLAYDCQVRQ